VIVCQDYPANEFTVATYQQNATEHLFEHEVKLDCLFGYELSDKNTTIVSTCQMDSNWLAVPTCQRKPMLNMIIIFIYCSTHALSHPI